jgi:hypothetical protein
MRAFTTRKPVLAARFVRARAMPSQTNKQISEPDLRQMTPAVASGFHHDHALHVGWAKARSAVPTGSVSVGFAAAQPTLQTTNKQKEAERRKTLSIILRNLRCGAREASRARLPAFHHGSRQRDSRIPSAQLGPGFPGLGADKRRVTPAGAAPGCSDAPRVPVIVPAGMMPEPPGSDGDEPPPAGTALAPSTGVAG